MKLGRAAAICAGAALLAVVLPMTLLGGLEPQAQTLARDGVVEASVQPTQDTLRLFPDVAKADVVTLNVTSPERSFEFERVDGEVSVNGNEADEAAFGLLLKKVIALPVSGRDAFDADTAPDLVVTLCTAAEQYTAAFYGDGQTGERVQILCGTQSGTVYRETDGWRVATILMACDGTRIFDEAGMEAPVN